MQFPLPPGFSELEQDTIDRLTRTGAPSNVLPQPIMPPPAKPIPITPVASQIDDSALRKALAETTGGGIGGAMRSLGNSMYNAVTDPSTIGPGMVQFGKGAASGATLGLSELIPGMTPDPESWAASAGNLAGFAVPGIGAAKGVAAGAKFLPGALKTVAGSTLGSNVISGGLLGPLDAKIRSSVEGTEEPNLAASAAMGAAIPVAAHGVGKLVGAGLSHFFGKAAPEVAEATAAAPVNPIKVLAPDMQAEYQKFVRARDVPPPETAPPTATVGPPTAGGLPLPQQNPAWDTVPLGGFQRGQTAYLPTGQPVAVRGIHGENISYTGEKGIGIRPASELRPELPPPGTPALHTSGAAGTFEGELPTGQQWFRATSERGPGAVGPKLSPVEKGSLRPLPEEMGAASADTARGGASVPPGDLHGSPPPVESSRPTGGGGAEPPPTPPPTTTGGGATPVGPSEAEAPSSIWEHGAAAARGLFRKLNLPIRVLGRNPETRATMDALQNFADSTQRWEAILERQKLRSEAGWSPKMKDFYKDAAAEYQGKPGIEAKLQQFPGTPQEVQALLSGHAMRNEYMGMARQGLVDRGMLRPEQDIENHLPWMRYKAVMPGEVKVMIDDAPRTVGYMNSWNMEHPRFRNFMLKTRNQTQDIPEAVKKMSLDELDAIKIKSFARGFAFHDEVVLGGKGQAGVIGQLQNGKPTYWIDQQLNNITNPELKRYAVDLVNHAAGVPKQSALLNSIMDAGSANKFAAQVRRLQFNHLIAGQFLTPLVNLTQSLITLSQVSTTNWGKAWKLVAQNTPHEGFKDLQSGIAMIPRDFAEKWAGASGTFNKADENVIQRGLFGKIAFQASKPFRWSERTNQRQAAIAGYLEANSRGLSGQEAVDFAKNINRYTQQFGGAVNTPEAFQGPLGSMIGQFKSYPIGFMGYMKDLFTRAGIGANMALTGEATRINPITNQPETAIQHMKPLIKFLVTTGALGGPAAFVNAFGEENGKKVIDYINDQVGVNLPDWTKAGFLGYMGVDLSNQLGFGALPLSSNLKDMMWFLPGPALSNLADAATVATYLFDSAGINTVFEPKAGPRAGMALDPQHILSGQVMGGVSPDDFVSRATRAFTPVAGPQLDKFRKFFKNQQTGNDEVEALNWLQAFGAEVPTGDLIRYSPDQAPIDQSLGIPEEVGRARSLVFNPLGRAEEIQRRTQMVEEGQDYTSALRTYHTLVAGGKGEEAQRFADQFYKRTGMALVPSDRALEEAYTRRMLPATIRMEQRAAWPIQVHERMNQ